MQKIPSTRIMEQEKNYLINRLHSISYKIAQYPLEKFKSNCFDPREIRLSYYLEFRAFFYNKDNNFLLLKKTVSNAEKDLNLLESNKTIVSLFAW